MNHLLIILGCFAVVTSPVFCQDAAYATATAQVKRFAAATCGIARHKTKPKLEVISSVPELKRFAEDIFAEITSEAGLQEAGDTQFLVLIGPRKEVMKKVPAIIPRQDFAVDGGDGYGKWWKYDRNSHLIQSPVVVFLFTDAGDWMRSGMKPKDPMLASKNYLLKGMLDSFGFTGKSPEFDDSCFSSKNKALRETLSPLDRMLISFAYKYVPPGTLSGQVWTLATTHWNQKK